VKFAARIAERTASPLTFDGVTDPTSTVALDGSYEGESGATGCGAGVVTGTSAGGGAADATGMCTAEGA
jgi:hypothetical protein